MYLNEIKQIGLIIVEHFLNENEFLENLIKSEIDFDNTTFKPSLKSVINIFSFVSNIFTNYN